MKHERAEQLEDLVSDLVKAEKKARRRGEAEDWHKLRTTSRRLRGALIAFGETLDRHSALARRAKRITRLPTKVRDLDVALENLATLRKSAKTDEERRAAREASRRLQDKRDRRAASARRRLQQDRPVKALRKVLRKSVRGSQRRTSLTPSRDALETCARAVLERQAALRGWEDDQSVHELRLAVKKYRGALMALSETHPALDGLQQLQQVLGEHHDWSELGRRLAGLSSDRHRAGYRGLVARARLEQRARYETYQRELHDRLPLLVTGHQDGPRLVSVSAGAAARARP